MVRLLVALSALALVAASPAMNPLAPTNLAQFQSDGTTSIPAGGTVSGTSVVLKATVNTTDAQATLRVEVKPVGSAFTGVASAQTGLVNAGQTGSVTVTGLTPGISYKWQAWVFCT